MSRIAAVLGGATRGLAELETLRTLAPVDAVFAVNDAAAAYHHPDLHSFVTLHPEKLPQWLALRANVDKLHKPDIVAHCEHPLVTQVVDYRWPGMNASGSSGLFAVKVALEKYDRVVLCGVPMDVMRAHFFDSAPWFDVDSFWDAWHVALPHIKDRVRSMSGRTANLLGMPTKEFLASGILAQNGIA
ncbi:hypothetical protein [Bradyrhizobium liaoningense]